MTWVRIDDEFPRHPKTLEGGPLAEILHVRACCYCSQNLTDGFLPASALRLLLVGFERLTIDGRPAMEIDWPKIMVNARTPRSKFGLWEPADGGWLVHDYLAYNPSRREVLAARREQVERSRLGGLSRARSAKRQSGRYVKHQPKSQPGDQPDTSRTAGSTAGKAHQPQHQPEHQPLTSRKTSRNTSRKPATAPYTYTEEEKAQRSPSVVSPTEPDSPDGVQPPAGSSDMSDNPDTDGAPADPGTRPTRSGQDAPDNGMRRSEPKALKDLLSPTQVARAKRLCGTIESMPRKVRDFHPWVFLQKCTSQGLPVDEGLKILVGMEDRWDRIMDPWAYAAEVLRKEYAQYRIDLQLQEHERRKREPARVGEILAEAQRKADELQPPSDKAPWK